MYSTKSENGNGAVAEVERPLRISYAKTVGRVCSALLDDGARLHLPASSFSSYARFVHAAAMVGHFVSWVEFEGKPTEAKRLAWRALVAEAIQAGWRKPY